MGLNPAKLKHHKVNVPLEIATYDKRFCSIMWRNECMFLQSDYSCGLFKAQLKPEFHGDYGNKLPLRCSQCIREFENKDNKVDDEEK
jgi:hypothetical protein